MCLRDKAFSVVSLCGQVRLGLAQLLEAQEPWTEPTGFRSPCGGHLALPTVGRTRTWAPSHNPQGCLDEDPSQDRQQ